MSEAAESIIADIYEAAVFPERWSMTLERICALGGFWGGATASSDGSAESWTITANAIELFTEFVTGGWTAKNERLFRLVRQGHLSFVGDLDIFTLAEWKQLPIYRDFLVPRGFGYGAATLITTPGPSHMIVTLESRLDSGPATPETIAMLNRIRPHLARALVLSAEVRQQRASDLLQGLSMASVPAALLTKDARIVSANPELEAMGGHLTIGARDRIVFRDAAVQALMLKALSEKDAVRSIVVPSADDTDAAVIHIVPLMKSARDLSSLASALMLVSHGASTPGDRFPLLKGLYDLTRAEARVAMAILAAASLPQIAEDLGVSYETVRSTAKSVYAKTGSSGQVDLVRRLAGLTRLSPDIL